MSRIQRILASSASAVLAIGLMTQGAVASEADPTRWTGDYFDTDDAIVTVTGTGAFGPSPGVVTGMATMSDPRVSGEFLAGYQWLCQPDESCSTWGEVTLANDGGTWEGEFVGFNGPAPGHLQNIMIWANGTGEYEGLGYVVNFIGPMSESIGTGKILAAPLPPQVSLDFSAASEG